MRSRIAVLMVLLYLAGCGEGAADAAGPLVLVKDGQARAVVVVPQNADEREQTAAKELAAYIKKISGADLPIVTQGEELGRGVRILLGGVAKGIITAGELRQALGSRDDDLNCRDGFVIKTGPNVLAISGIRSTGTLFGAYAVLERLGCRWFWPGELGEVVPKNATISLEQFSSIQSPSFDYRTFWFSGDHQAGPLSKPWGMRVRLSQDYQYVASHTDHPDIKDPRAGQIKADQIIASGPGGKWVTLGWSDSYADVTEEQGLGRVHEWNPQVWFATDTLIAYYNDVAERVNKKYPEKRFGFLAYMNYLLPPTEHEVNPSLAPMVAPIEQCPLHAPYGGKCWQRDLLFDGIKKWCELSDKVFIYDYEPGFLVSGKVPWPCVNRVRVEVPLLGKWGLRGFLHQSQLSLMNQGPNLYVMAKLMWDAEADVDALLDDYYSKLFGPAAQPVRAYWDALEEMTINSPVHQHEEEIAKIVYPLDKVRPLGRFIEQAEAAADSEVIRRRVKVIRYSYDNLMLYLQMREAEDRVEFVEAARLAERQFELHKEADAFDTAIYKMGDLNLNDEDHRHLTGGYIMQNKERQAMIDGTTGELVAMLPDSWSFTTDPEDEGLAEKWFAAETDTSNWQSIRVSRVWEAQGLQDEMGHGYDGAGWYRIEFDVPQRFAGRDMKLDFGGAYGSVKVWLNGQECGERIRKKLWWFFGYNTNFDIDLTEAIKPGQKNVLVVRVHNEFEWGGIYRRVFVYSPVGSE